MNGTTQIILGGQLGTRFGREWNLLVSTPAEAIRAIDVNTGGKLRAFMGDREANRHYRIALGRRDNEIDPKKELHNRVGRTVIYVLPVVKGRNSGFGKILAGIAIIALAFATGGASIVAGSIVAGTTGTIALGLGASLILGGITQLLTPTPNFNQNSEGDSRGSNVFQGNAVVVSQGGAVGLIYGRALVTPMPIMIAYNSSDQLISSDQPVGGFRTVIGPGGVINVIPVDPPDQMLNQNQE